MSQLQRQYDLPKIIFIMIFISIIIIASFWILQPFILGLSWAGMVVIATWPFLIRLESFLLGKRSLAVIVMTLLLVLLFMLPISLMIESLVDNSSLIITWAGALGKLHIPDPVWLRSLPMLGDNIYNSYHVLINANGAAILAKIQPYFGQTATWLVAQVANVGRLLVHCTLMLLFSAILYARGEQIALGIRRFSVRLFSERGSALVLLGGQAIRAVALSVVVTALVQTVLAGIGLALSGIAATTWLTVLIFICCVAQLGPLPILIPSIIWFYWSGNTTWAMVLIIWSCVVATLDNVLRPMLIRMESDLPTLLIFMGVVGGLLAFGLIGLFIGPVVLAVSYRLFTAWMDDTSSPTPNC